MMVAQVLKQINELQNLSNKKFSVVFCGDNNLFSVIWSFMILAEEVKKSWKNNSLWISM